MKNPVAIELPDGSLTFGFLDPDFRHEAKGIHCCLCGKGIKKPQLCIRVAQLGPFNIDYVIPPTDPRGELLHVGKECANRIPKHLLSHDYIYLK